MFTRSMLSTSIALAVALSSQSLLAQENDDAAIEEIVVTGIRASLAKSVDIKRENFSVVDAIVAEDIGKFPDNNVVEAMQRISGVQVTNRGSGEIAGVSIRGLTDVTTTVNGRSIFTSSGLSVALQDIPASLLKQVDVYKTRSASQIETGIAGSIDVKTQRPLDFDGSKVLVAARAIHQEQADKTDPHFSALLSNRWEVGGGEFGALLNVSLAKTNYRDQSVTAGAMVPFATENPVAPFGNYERIFLDHGGVSENPIWQPGLISGLPSAPGSTLDVNGTPMEYILGRDAIFASDFTGERERNGVNLSLQYAPNDASVYTFEAFYNSYRNESFNSLLFSFADWWGDYANSPTAVQDANVVLFPGTNIVKSRSVSNNFSFTSGDLNTGKTDSYLYAFGGEWDLANNLKLKSEIVYQDSEFNTDFVAMRYEGGRHGVNVDFNSGGGIPSFGFIDNPATADLDEANVADIRNWTTAQLYDNSNRNTGDSVTFTSDLTWEESIGIFNTFRAGIRVDDRSAAEYFSRQEGFNNSIAITPEMTYTNRNFFDGNSDVPTTWAVADGHYLRGNIDEYRGLYNLDRLSLDPSFEISELSTALYVSATFETEVAGRVLDGEIGLRYAAYDTDMTFFDSSSANLDRYTAKADTSKVLPSLTLRYALTDDLLARFAYTQTLRRPAFASLNSQIIYNQDVSGVGYGTATGGNPSLAPVESVNYDLSLEWYFAEGSSLYGTLFKRDIEGLVVDMRRQITGPKLDGTPGTFILTQPANGSDGNLEGLEIGAIWFPENLPRVLDGFGIQASYTMLDSSLTTPDTDDEGNIIGYNKTNMGGVSDSSYSVVLAYEKEKLGARLSYTWRKEFFNNYEAALFANPREVWRAPEQTLDLQISYQVNDSLMITLDGTNLTEEIYQSYYGEGNARTHSFGSSLYSRTFALGARYSF